ncbi:PAS domain S-box protein [Klebsiella michiganensis]|nr:PAS domain S-box protein [Klebsiella michiganensis]
MTLNMMLDNAVPEAIAGALTQQHPGLFFTMVEQASVAISLTDARANIIYANPAFCRQSGYSLAQLLNQNPRLLVPAARRRAKSTSRCGKPCFSASRGAAS